MPVVRRLHHNPNPLPDWSAFGVHLSRYQIDEVLHYTHPLPNIRGYTKRFFDKRYPGWGLGSFFKVFQAAGVLLDDGIGAPYSGRCHWQMRTLHFDSRESFAVEWDEAVTADDGHYYWAGRPGSTGRGAFNEFVEPEQIDDPVAASTFVDQLCTLLGSVDKADRSKRR